MMARLTEEEFLKGLQTFGKRVELMMELDPQGAAGAAEKVLDWRLQWDIKVTLEDIAAMLRRADLAGDNEH
jgi:hypothetical protein